jgi:hypothetical protein
MAFFPSNDELRSRRLLLRWYYHPATDSQRAALRKLGTEEALGAVRRDDLTKGEASDLIGQSRPCDDTSAEVLKFFRLDPDNYCEIDAVEMVVWLQEQPELWGQFLRRPLDLDERDYFRLLNIPEPVDASEARRLFEEVRQSDRAWKRFTKLQYAEHDRIQKIVFEVDEVLSNLASAAEEAGIYFEVDQDITLGDEPENFVWERIRAGETTGHNIALFEHLLERLHVAIYGDLETIYRMAKNPRSYKKLVSSMSRA